MSPGVRTEECFGCFGKGGDFDHDDNVWCKCEGCGGHGSVICCIGCGDSVTIDEAATHGAYCEGCRVSLDATDQEMERGELCRTRVA